MLLKLLERSPQFVRFGVIGVINTGVHALVLTALVELAHCGVVLANTAAFMVSNVFSYFMNAAITFHAPPTIASYLKFFTASLLALGSTMLISGVMAHLGFHYLQGFLVVIVLVPAISYLAIKVWVFSGNKA